MSCNPSALLPDASGEILQQLEILRQRTQETSEDLRRMEQEQEAFALEYHELTKIQANLTHLQNQAPSQQKNDFEKQLRIKKDMSEHKLNVKVVKKQNMLSWLMTSDQIYFNKHPILVGRVASDADGTGR